jgi:hypothetical protein
MFRIRFGRFGLLLTILAIGALSAAIAAPQAQQGTPRQTVTVRQYIPLATKGNPSGTVFGVEMLSITPNRNLDGVVDIGASYVRRNGLLWKEIEPVEGGGYNWNAPSVKQLEQEFINASERKLTPILIVRAAPAWAVGNGRECSPILPSKYVAFANFLAAAVQRYSNPPYNVQHWELYNEPDVNASGDTIFGCWLEGDPVASGRAYGAMLNVVYPRVKAVNPNVQVLNGGLALIRPYNPQTGADSQARFMEGVFEAGAGRSFDILNFHSYCYYQYDGNADGEDNRGQPCINDWKAPYLRDMMRRYNVPEKPLINTETALLCFEATADCFQKQADFVGRQYARALKDRLYAQIWYIYDLDSFRNTGLVDPNNPTTPRPAYTAYKHAATQLRDAQFVGALDGQPAGVVGYRFQQGPGTLIMVWSNTPQNILLPVGAGASVSCTNRDGSPVACTNTNGSVAVQATSGPTYIVVR